MSFKPSYILIGSMILTSGCHREAPSTTPQAQPTHDISGTWERYPENWYGADPDHPQLPGGPFDLKQPYADQYAERKKKEGAADAAGSPLVNASSRCLPEGMPTIMAAIYPIQIVQAKDQVIVLAEFLAQTRRIWLNVPLPAPDDISPSYNGQAVGHWDGDTLVVQTKGVREDSTFYDMPHSEDMVITERLKRSAPGRITNQVTIEDPQTLKTPYRFTFEYKKSDYKIQEYVCDNNQIKVNADGGTQLDINAIRK